MSETIKVGDKVRVSKDAPRIYTPDWVDEMFNLVLKVTKVEDGNAMVVFAERTLYKTVLTAIPTKYLIKVEDEAKEPKFKVGDVVRIKPDVDKLHQGYQNGYAWLPERDNYLGRVASVKEIWCDGSIILNIGSNLMWGSIDLEPYTEPTTPTIKVGDRVCCYNILHIKGSKKEDYMGYVASITDMGITIQLDKGGLVLVYHESDLERVQPTEPTEAEKKPNIGSIKIPVEVDLTDSYWTAYTADLAKEIALKVANEYSNPKEAAGYAVSVAKAVVENLKKK